MFAARVDQRYRGTLETFDQPVGQRGAARPCADDDDARLGHHLGGPCRRADGRGGEPGGGKPEKAPAGGLE